MWTMKVDADRVIAQMAARKAALPQKLNAVVTALTLKLLAAVQTRAPVLTGRLRRSIFSEVAASQAQVLGRVFVSNDTPYARIQEYGGKTPAHDIYPTKAQALRFVVGGSVVFAKVVHHPGSKIPAKLYVHGPFEEMKPEIVAKIEAAVAEAVQ